MGIKILGQMINKIKLLRGRYLTSQGPTPHIVPEHWKRVFDVGRKLVSVLLTETYFFFFDFIFFEVPVGIFVIWIDIAVVDPVTMRWLRKRVSTIPLGQIFNICFS